MQRAAAKNVIFGTLYGMGYRALAAQNSVKVDVVRQYIQDFREQHLQACEYMETIQKQALSQVRAKMDTSPMNHQRAPESARRTYK